MKKSRLITLLSNIVILLVVGGLGLSAAWATGRSSSVFAPIRKGPIKQTAALTVNVYLGTQYVEQIMQVLLSYNVPATFFLGGCWVVKHKETAQKLVQNGFCVGSHGYSHLDHSALSYGQNVAELNKAKQTIEEVLGADIHLFAPPSGAYGESTLAACRDLGYTVVMWSKDAIDWRDQEVETIVRRTTQNKQDSEIILLHPTAATVAALPTIIESYLADGYRFVSVDEMV